MAEDDKVPVWTKEDAAEDVLESTRLLSKKLEAMQFLCEDAASLIWLAEENDIANAEVLVAAINVIAKETTASVGSLLTIYEQYQREFGNKRQPVQVTAE